jgi:transcriptional regulator with PAS, ATPase and Fis domain
MDLFYRIAVATINIPPLRERSEDVQLIADFLLDKLSQQHAVFRPVLDPDALECLSRYAWPGNIRELRNVLERALLMSSDAVITKESLPHEVQFAEPPGLQRMTSVPQEGELKRLEQVEKDTIISMIERQNGNMTSVARELGIAKSTLYVKLKKFDIALSGTSAADVSANGFAA